MRVFEVYNKETDTWTETMFEEIKEGDLFRIFDDGERYVDDKTGKGTWVAYSDPYIHPHGYQVIDA